jgi:hypothetical protein
MVDVGSIVTVICCPPPPPPQETRKKMLVRPTMKEIARRMGTSFSGQELLRYNNQFGLGGYFQF